MKKTYTLSIGGQLFHVEEDAYEKLDTYITSIRTSFASNPDKDEILSDIEGRIAEKFGERGATIIAVANVDEVIKVMGTADQLGDNEAEPQEQIKGIKKLYRDTDNEMVAGAASGIAAYFGVDPLIIRLLFVISLFAGGTGVIVYLLLWMLVPEAKTAAQKLSMRGNPVTVSSLAETIKERIEEVKNPKHKHAILKLLSLPIEMIGKLLHVIQKVFFPAVRILLGAFVIVGSFILAVLATIALCFALFGVSPNLIEGPLLSLIQTPLARGLAIALYLVAFIPLITIFTAGIGILVRKRVISKIAIISLAVLWFGAISVGGALGARFTSDVTTMLENDPYYKTETTLIPVQPFNELAVQDGQSVHIVEGKEYKMEITGRHDDISSIVSEYATGTLTLSDKRDERTGPCIICGRGHVSITVTVPTLSALHVTEGSYVSGDMRSSSMFIELDNGSNVDLGLTATNLQINVHDGSDANLSGVVDTGYLEAMNSSSIDSDQLEVRVGNLKAANSSRIVSYIKQSLILSATNSSSIEYAGKATVTEKHIDTSSRIESEEEITK